MPPIVRPVKGIKMHFDRLADARCALRIRAVVSWRRRLAACAALFVMSWTGVASAALCYVNGDPGNTGANTGVSWTDAYTNLQSALNSAGCTEIWVAQYTYKPDPSNAAISFNIGPNVAVYGGFAGGETSRSARNPLAHATTLSGAISGGNSQHVVVMNGTTGTPITATTVLDGFTLTGGNNSSSGGGALWCRGNGAGHACSPTLANLVFSGNHAGNGGAVELDGYSGGVSNPTLTNITFSNNTAGTFGGALYCNAQLSSGTCSPTLTNVTFNNNSSATYGGAMFNDGTSTGNSSPTLTNVAFYSNSATSNGGAMYNNGSGGYSHSTLTNVTFSGNSAANGGAMFNNGSSGGDSYVTLTNVTFSGNSATSNGGGLYYIGTNGNNTTPLLTNVTFSGNSAANGGAIYNGAGFNYSLLLNSILWGDSATSSGPEYYGGLFLNSSILQNGCAPNSNCSGTNIYTGDPKLGSLQDNGGFTLTMMPGGAPGSNGSSAAINQISCTGPDSAPATDQRGYIRPDPASRGLANACDIGAVEANSVPDEIFVNGFEVQ